jgi:hypothetical protein
MGTQSGNRPLAGTMIAPLNTAGLNVRFTPKADIGTQSWNVRFVPEADIS